MPSLLGLMDLPIPAAVEGTDFSPAMRGKRVKKPEVALIEYFRNTPESGWRGLRTRRYTYVALSSARGRYGVLFDNRKDPYQMNPTEAKDGENKLMDELWNELKGRLEQMDDPWLKANP